MKFISLFCILFGILILINCNKWIPELNNKPDAIIQVEQVEYLKMSFDATNSTDDKTIEQYLWNFGDGKTSVEPIIEHTYEKPGIYSVELKVTDDDLETSSARIEIEVIDENQPPVAIVKSNSSTNIENVLYHWRFYSTDSYDKDGYVKVNYFKITDYLTKSEIYFASTYLNGIEYYFSPQDLVNETSRKFIVELQVEDNLGLKSSPTQLLITVENNSTN